jgi:hypothetical protein
VGGREGKAVAKGGEGGGSGSESFLEGRWERAVAFDPSDAKKLRRDIGKHSPVKR